MRILPYSTPTRVEGRWGDDGKSPSSMIQTPEEWTRCAASAEGREEEAAWSTPESLPQRAHTPPLPFAGLSPPAPDFLERRQGSSAPSAATADAGLHEAIAPGLAIGHASMSGHSGHSGASTVVMEDAAGQLRPVGTSARRAYDSRELLRVLADHGF